MEYLDKRFQTHIQTIETQKWFVGPQVGSFLNVYHQHISDHIYARKIRRHSN